jgi:hypothetical protein
MANSRVRESLDDLKAILARHASVRAAETELGLPHKAITDRMRRAGLHASDFLAKVAVPEGMRIRSITTGPGGQTVHADRESDDPPAFAPVPDGHYVKGLSTFLGPQGEVRGQWVKTDQEREQRDAAIRLAFEAVAERYAGLGGKSVTIPRTNPNLHVLFPLGDPHIGMYSWGLETGQNFDLHIAEKELFGVVDDLVERSPAAESCTILNVGDYFHAQNDKQLTPGHGFKLDVDGRAAKVNEVGCALMVRLIDRARRKYRKVRADMVPGNHDPDLARWLAHWLRAWYKDDPHVEVVPNYNVFGYWSHGKNLFGRFHGNGVKLDRLPGIMAADVPKLWGETTHWHWHTGHVHHRETIELGGVLVHSWRTLAPNDAHGHTHGYRSGKSLSALAYHADGGEYSRVTSDLAGLYRRIVAQSG